MARTAPKKYCDFCGLEGIDEMTPGAPGESATDGWWQVRGPMVPGKPTPIFDYCKRVHKDLDADPNVARPEPVNPLPPDLKRPRPHKQ